MRCQKHDEIMKEDERDTTTPKAVRRFRCKHGCRIDQFPLDDATGRGFVDVVHVAFNDILSGTANNE